MGKFTVGDIVLINFPYSDFTKFKKRPALVVGNAEFNNYILCQITSSPNTSKKAIKLTNKDIVDGSLPVESFIRPDKVFTVDQDIIIKKIGLVSNIKVKAVKSALAKIFEL